MSKERQKHTPGPWFINGPWHIQAESTPDACHPQVICQMTPHTHGRLVEKREANARLIVAAPEMLAQLRGWLAIFTAGGAHVSPLVAAAMKETAAIVRKAEGE